MSRKTYNNIARGIGVAAVLAMSSFAAQAQTTIYVGVAANFANPLNDIISAYKSSHPGTDIIYTSASTGVLKGQILPNCHSGPYDLFLAADQAAPNAVEAATSGGTDCSLHYPSGNSPFLYTSGSIVLWSDTVTTLNSGLPNPLNANLVIADPSNAPYGNAAMTVLNSSPWSLGLTPTGTYPSGYVYTAPNIDETYNRIVAHTYPYAYGFVAKSKVCHRSGGVEVYSGAASHHEYVYNDPSHPYSQLTQYGVAIDRGQGSPELALLYDFIDYLLTDTTARGIIADYCYS